MKGVPKEEQARVALGKAWKWMLNNLLFLGLALIGRFQVLHYESLYDDPTKHFLSIGKRVNLDFLMLANHIQKERPIKVQNVIAGSRGVRSAKTMIVKMDTKWEKHLTNRDQKRILRLTRWLLFFWGYRK